MITCPECGELAQDNATFCDRCGQGLTRAAASSAASGSTPQRRAGGRCLGDGFAVVETLPGTSIENRYRVRRTREGKIESFIIRERGADTRADPIGEEPPNPPGGPAPDPNGPTAKTAE